ncbi:TetR/AcrR family transcriptional regulator [Hamadaea tsunoensis]|uniref:TetR/AcrR family transcriptional regulator n=1 Tax=Hamadaea tsunoensis TaxID=53368 RepID=UPI0004006539|nr:TetR family transcriptional regulator [Hamadaea tsunoensis]
MVLRRDLKKQQTRDALVDAALRLAAERGLDHVTVEEISAEAGVSGRTFFNYFATKDDALLDERPGDVARMRRSLTELLPKMPVLPAIHRSLLIFIAAMEADRERWVLRMRAIEKTPSLLPRLINTGAQAELETARLIADHLGVDAAGYPALVVGVTGAAFRVALIRWATAPDGALSLGALVDEAFTSLAQGLRDPGRP